MNSFMRVLDVQLSTANRRWIYKTMESGIGIGHFFKVNQGKFTQSEYNNFTVL